MKSINPKNNQPLKEYTPLKDEEVTTFIKKADQAFHNWRKTKFKERSQILNQTANVLEEQKEELALLITNEMGKPLAESKSEIEKCAWVCRYYAENAENFLKPEPVQNDDHKSFVTFQPMGCIFAIMPWNYPFWQVFRFAAPTLMAGNVGLLKHAENVSGCSLAIQDVFSKAGLPDSVFTSLLIDRDQAAAVIENRKIKAVTLTGSTGAGRAVAAKAGEFLKKSVLELGGSDAYIVLADADIEKAVETCSKSRLLNAGQSCISAKRFIVHQSVIKDFTNRLTEKFKQSIVGDPLSESTTIGPMARIDLRDQLHKQVEKSVTAGAICVLGGEKPNGEGAFYPPTILTQVKKGMPAYHEELFGPVTSVIEVQSIDEALKIANESDFGLGGAVFTKDLKLGEKIATEDMDCGACFVNDFVKSDPRLPFGGVKDSGYGRELSSFGIREFVNIKAICVKSV